jgi:hypothetical protein
MSPNLFPEPDTIRNAGFADFWALIPRGAKSSKIAAERAFRKLTPARRLEAIQKVAAYYAWWAKLYPDAAAQGKWLHPASYLNQRRWEDEAFSPPAVNETTKDRAAFWAEQINSGKPISRFAVTPTLCDEMVARKLVTPAQLRERGLG